MNQPLKGTSLGVVGLGVLGGIFAKHLLEASMRLNVLDLEPARVAGLVNEGASACADPASLLDDSDIVVLSLPNPPAVNAVFQGPRGLLSTSLEGKLLIDTSTVDPGTNRSLAREVELRGGLYLDAPVSGAQPMQAGENGALASSMTFMVGGPEEGFDRAIPVFEVLGNHWFHLGQSGAGSAIKLISNLCSGLYVLVAAEAFALGAAAGVEPERLIEVFSQTDAKSYVMTDYLLPRVLANNTTPGFSLGLQLKDHRLAAQLAQELHVPAQLNAAAVKLYSGFAEQGYESTDISSVIVASLEQARLAMA